MSASTYHVWAARFIREDAFFATFGLVMVAFRAGMYHIRRTLAPTTSPSTESGG